MGSQTFGPVASPRYPTLTLLSIQEVFVSNKWLIQRLSVMLKSVHASEQFFTATATLAVAGNKYYWRFLNALWILQESGAAPDRY